MKRAGFYVLKYNTCPAVLIESLFLDNLREAGIWREAIFVETLAAAVAGGVERALGVGASAGASPSPRPSPLEGEGFINNDITSPAAVQTLYTVQVGAFAYIDNARQCLAEAQQAGFKDAYIYRKELSS
jgi:hypothetical protein